MRRLASFPRTPLAMAAIAPVSVDELLELLNKSNILPAERLKELPSTDSLPSEPRKAAKHLVQQGFITRFQSTQLLAGRHKGFRIGPYAILDLLGRGGMGAVYLGEHLELRRKVAIKVLAPCTGDGQQLASERFLREARAAAALDHPNIVRVFDVARHGETLYLVMEYLVGVNLQQLLDRDGPLPYEVAAENIAQAAAGLQHAHERGFIHRDIKPGNLMRDQNGVVKILDMGLARDSSDRDKITEQLDHGAVVGTADFISPEQAIGSPHVDGRADIYSLGATLYTLLVGKTPFTGNTTQKLLQHQLKEAPTLSSLNGAIPEELADIVTRMLAKKPNDRFQIAAEVVAALAPWAGDKTLVLNGLTHTKLAETSGAHSALSSLSLSNTGRPNSKRHNADTATHALQESTTGTSEMSSAETVRKKSPKPSPAPEAPPRRLWLLFAGIAAALIVTALGGWLAFGRGKPKDAVNAAPSENQLNQGVTTQQPPTAVVGYQLNLTGLKPFVHRVGMTVDPNDSAKRSHKTVSQIGPGKMLAGWQVRCYASDTEVEAYGEIFDGHPILGLRVMHGRGTGRLFTPHFNCPSSVCKLRIEHSSNMGEGTFLIRFKPSDQREAFDVAIPAVGGNDWRTEEWQIDLKGATSGTFEFYNKMQTPDSPIRIRALSITEVTAAKKE